MKYIIIGLGNYGRVLAEELSALGHEIIGADISESRVDSIKDKVATAFVIDATDEQALSVLPLNSVDIVIVAIGENFGASVRVVALLKQKKVAHIYARAIDMVHKAVLEAFSLEKILTPKKMRPAVWCNCWILEQAWKLSVSIRNIMSSSLQSRKSL